MRVYVDMRCLQDPGNLFRGIGRHTLAVLRKTHTFGDIKIVGLLDQEAPDLPDIYKGLAAEYQSAFIPLSQCDTSVFLNFSPMHYDPTQLAPFLGRQKVFAATVVYDFIPLDCPESLVSASSRRAYLNYLIWLKLYQLYLPISEFTARRLKELLGVPERAIGITGASLRNSYLDLNKRHNGAIELPSHLKPYSYFLVVSPGEPHKNIECAIKAHAGLAASIKGESKLVLVINYYEQQKSLLKNLYKSAGGHASQIVFVSNLSDDELAVLYRHAAATVCSSRMEGFSLPVVEAISCGSPVLASTCDAHRELLSQTDSMFDPDDCERLSQLMERFLRRPETRTELLKGQEPIVARFTEHEVSRRFWTRLQKDFDAWSTPRKTKTRHSKPRIAVLSPYPPDQTVVADYTAACLPALSRHATVDLYTDAPLSSCPPAIRHLAPISSLPYVLDEYDRVVAVIGNSLFHSRIIECHCRYGGVALVHDSRLAEFYYSSRGATAFAQMASRSIGKPVTPEEIQDWFSNPDHLPKPFLGEIIPKSDGLILSLKGQQEIAAHGADCSAIQYLPLCPTDIPDEKAMSMDARIWARKDLAIPQDSVAIISSVSGPMAYGDLDVLWTLDFLRYWGLPCALYFLNHTNESIDHLVPLITKLGLESCVRFDEQSHVESTYSRYVQAADFGLILNPDVSFASAKLLLDFAGTGLTAICPEGLAKAIEAPEYVHSVPDHISALLAAESLYNAWDNGLHTERSTDKWRAFVEDRNMSNYANRLVHLIGLD